MRHRYETTYRWTAIAAGLLALTTLIASPSMAQRDPMTLSIPAAEPFILNQALTQAVDGDTFVLTTSGSEGAYLDTTLHIDKDVTIMADPDLDSPPQIHFHWEGKTEGGSSNQMFLESADLNLQGLVFGRVEGDSISQFIEVSDGDPRSIRISDSEFRNGSKFIIQTTPAALVDSLIVTDTYVHDMGLNLIEIEFAADASNFVQVHNSTFAYVRNVITLDGGGPNSVLDVDHITVDNANIAIDANDQPWSIDSSVRNSVFTRGRTVTRWVGPDSPDPDSAIVANSLYFDLSRAFAKSAIENETIIAETDPLYVSADAWPYDFSYQDGSAALGAADDGTDLGDARWNSTVTAAEGPELPPDSPQLLQNYPNPFNPATEIQFEMPAAAEVTLRVHDTLGRRVATLVNGYRAAGMHAATFDAANLPSGVYFYRLEIGDEVRTRAMTLMK